MPPGTPARDPSTEPHTPPRLRTRRRPLVSLADAAESGCRATALEALRDRLARDLDDCVSARDVASLAARLMDVLAQLADLGVGVDVVEEVTAVDEFTARLKARSVSASAGGATGS